MIDFLNGSREMTEARRKVSRALERVPEFDSTYDADMTRREWRRRLMERVRAGYRIMVLTAGDPTLRQAAMETLGVFDPSFWTRFGVHFGLFQTAISGQGDEEQQAEWMPLLMGLKIYGSFGMTELGHGSFVRGVETTATFIPPKNSSDDGHWDINTPSLTATKWWIGAAAHTATHCAVFAQTIINGQRYGVHTFVVPVRDLETLEVFPGVVAGDIGKKMGRDGIDNGFLQFHNVVVPRRNMLMKHAVVDRHGEFQSKPKSTQQLEYFALVAGRATMVKDAADWMKRALTVTIRYSAIRRQGESMETTNGNESQHDTTSESAVKETQILNYLTHQYRLIPYLAEAYAFHLTAAYMKALGDRVSDEISSGDFSGLPDMHATSAGLKAFCTWSTYSCIETCRHCLGGHGYSSYTGLSKMLADFAVQCTWEGDNVVLALQTSRYLFRCYEKVQEGKEVNGSVKYLQVQLPRTCGVKNMRDWCSWEQQSAALRNLAKSKVSSVGERLLRLYRQNVPANKAWNACSVDLFEASKIHVYWNMASVFNDAVQKQYSREKNSGSSGNIAPTLEVLRNLFVLNFLSKRRANLLELGFVSSSQSRQVTEMVQDLCATLRKVAVPLVDSFDFTDFILESPLGRYDGDIYKAYMAKVVNAPGCFEGARDYKEDLIKPMLTGEDVFKAASQSPFEE